MSTISHIRDRGQNVSLRPHAIARITKESYGLDNWLLSENTPNMSNYSQMARDRMHFPGFEALVHGRENELDTALGAMAWGDPYVGVQPFENPSLKFRFPKLNEFVEELTEQLDPLSEDSDALQAVTRSFHFSHQLSTILLGRPAPVGAEIPEYVPGTGYRDHIDDLLTQADTFYAKAPTIKSFKDKYMGNIDGCGDHADAVTIVTALALQYCSDVETTVAAKHSAAKFASVTAGLEF